MHLESKFDNCLHGTLFYSPSVLRWPVWGGGGAVKVTVVLVGQRDVILGTSTLANLWRW